MAKIFGNILVPNDNSSHSKRALDKAFRMVEITGVDLTLVHVISYDETVAKIIKPHTLSMKKYF